VSVLTKVFVVLLALFSIVLSAFVVATFAQQENWKQSATDWKAAALDAQAEARAITNNAALEQQRALARHQDDLGAMNAFKAQLTASQQEMAKCSRERDEALNKLTVEQGSVAGLTEHSKLLRGALDREEQFSAQLATRNSKIERVNTDLNDRVKELTANLAMAKSRVRALKEQISGLADAGGARQIPGGDNIVQPQTPSVASPAIVAAMTSPIRAEVTDVKGERAQISVGSADGVAPGMKFLMYRPGAAGGKPQYLATLRITKVEANRSAGMLEETAGDVRVGDLARDEASFALRG